MRHVKVTQELCDKEKERMDSNGYYQNTEWRCNKCGWNISFTDDCVVTSVHDYWQEIQDHNHGYSGIYHSWCRELCKVCNHTLGDYSHTRCNEALEAEKRMAKQEAVERKIQETADMMYNSMIDEKLK